MSGMSNEAQAFEQEKAEALVGLVPKAPRWGVAVEEYDGQSEGAGMVNDFRMKFRSFEAANEWLEEYLDACDEEQNRNTKTYMWQIDRRN